MNTTDSMDNQKELLKKLDRIEKQLQKVRGCSPLTHGWQTSRYAKASRKWDELAKEKIRLKTILNELCTGHCACCMGNINCKYP